MNRTLMMAGVVIALTACGKSPLPPEAAATSTPVAAVASPDKPAARSDASRATGAACRTSAAPVRLAMVTEADLMGVPVYPAAGAASGFVVSDPKAFQAVAQQSTVDPPEKVLTFYRERLRAQAAGRELTDSGPPDAAGNTMLELSGRDDQPDVQIVTTGNKDGTHLQVSVSCFAK